jgi:hypothetical protein
MENESILYAPMKAGYLLESSDPCNFLCTISFLLRTSIQPFFFDILGMMKVVFYLYSICIDPW